MRVRPIEGLLLNEASLISLVHNCAFCARSGGRKIERSREEEGRGEEEAGERKREGEEENEEDGPKAQPTLARAVSVGLMAVTSRSWPDEILHLARKRERRERNAKPASDKNKNNNEKKEEKKTGKKKEGGMRIRCSASWGATAYIYRFKPPSLDVMEQMMENDVDGVADENDGERLYASDDHENLSMRSEEFQEEEKEEAEAEAEEEEEENDIYKADESFIRDEELGEHDYEEERYRERSLEDEGIEGKRDIPSATISIAAEKPEEEVQEVIEPDHVLADTPVEIFANRETMIRKLKEFLAEQAELRKKNRLLEVWITKHMKKAQEKVMIPTDVTKESEQMEQNYIQTLHTYKLHLDDVTEKRVRTMADMQSYEDKARKVRDENARIFDELLDREREVATGLVYAKTGRKMTEKAVNEITRRQMSRREILARNRYEYIVLRHRFDQMKTLLRNLETLGEGMTTMDYETLYIARVNYKDKLDERDRELEKLRFKIAQVVNGVAHYKEKETCLAEDIEFEERELDEYREQTARVREDVNKLHLILRDLRQAHDERRLEGGMLLAPPVLREMERMIKLLDALRNDIEIIKREIQQCTGPANGRKRNSKVLAISMMTHQKPGRS
ncbi:LOW QUALITY PROTEIN: cilia- and flagella-associated protein 184-like [Polyergus mexicanus]|uniref:LOW QUALITY PROTEIN: cilia- and flagella-associated protein 184-like n=1 Tax=Polyergus mexicanus TaxID=615972 RepID=UPI0038B61937